MLTRIVPFSAVVLFPVSLCAQDSSSRAAVTPFRRGQWAAQFQVGFGSASLGFLKFRSPTRALVVDLRLSGAHSEQSVTDSTGATQFASLNSGANTQIRFGSRRYHGGADNLVSHFTLGLLAGFDHGAGRSRVASSETNTWTAGLFGDVGGTYLVTPQLGLGALATVALAYSNSVSHGQPGNYKSRSWQIGGSAINATFVVTLFF